MDDKDIITQWQSYDKKLAENLTLTRKNTEALFTIQVQSLLASMKPVKTFTLVVGILWVVFIDSLLINLFAYANPFFLISAGIQALLTKLAVGVYIYQLVLINQVDPGEPVVATQQRIAALTASSIWIARLLFLQLPVWTTFYWNESMLTHGSMALYLLQATVTVSFTLVAVWLFQNINYANRDKKWFRLMFNGNEWVPMLKSMELLDQLKTFRDQTPLSAR